MTIAVVPQIANPHTSTPTISQQILQQFVAAHQQGLIEHLEIRRGITAHATDLIYAIHVKLPSTIQSHILESLTQYLKAKGCMVTHRLSERGALTIQMSPQCNRI